MVDVVYFCIFSVFVVILVCFCLSGREVYLVDVVYLCICIVFESGAQRREIL